MKDIVTRFAPSPTGSLHVGGARTAIFNWLYARSTGGKFILRIEDTDLKRSSKEAVDIIFEAFKWMGIDWDEGPFFQSDRYDIYYDYLKKLLKSGQAYYCNCSKDDVEKMRENALARGLKPKYDGTCRNKNINNSINSVIRFKSLLSGETIVDDLVKGKVIFKNVEQDDFIISRSDGSPTYNFVVVVDDITMGINTVLRGDDHLMNTPRQIMLYKALNQSLPSFGHIPMVLGLDKSRLSKRHGSVSVLKYRDLGYLPDAFINYIVRLGWSHGNDEFFMRDDLIKIFDIKNIGKSPSIFDNKKLMALNFEHLKKSSDEKIKYYLNPFMKDKGYDFSNQKHLSLVINSLRNRSKTLLDLAEKAFFYYEDIFPCYEEKVFLDFLTPDIYKAISLLLIKLKELDLFDEKSQQASFKYVVDHTNFSFGKIAQTVRVILTGGKVSPGIFEIMEILGKEIVIIRLERAVDFILGRKTK